MDYVSETEITTSQKFDKISQNSKTKDINRTCNSYLIFPN